MEHYRVRRGSDGVLRELVPLRGKTLLSHSFYNRGTAFTLAERDQLEITGHLPHVVAKLEEQVLRAYRGIKKHADPLAQYLELSAIQDRNERLFYRVLEDHIEEFLPIIYTPTVGLACQSYSHILRRSRGLFITPDHKGRIEAVLRSAPYSEVRLLVVTDNERILGLGDQGAGGIGIPIGKLVLYTVAAGLHPTRVLPVSLDVGTDNTTLLEDPLYVGWRKPRLRGTPYIELVDEFVNAVQRVFPRALLQWEDFKKQNALDLLARYRHVHLSFNDDIQGTAAVGVAGVIAASKISKTRETDQRVLMLGAGAAGVGISQLVRDYFRHRGVEEAHLARCVAVLDSGGLLIANRDLDNPYKKALAWPVALAESMGFRTTGAVQLEEAVRLYKPTILIGTSGQPDVFTEAVVREMAKHVERPAIFPFSNPTSKAEAKPKDIIHWTDGRALVATGSPFEPVVHNGRTFHIGQGNNVYVFPGVGLGALIANASQVTDSMFLVAAEALAQYSALHGAEEGRLFPRLTELKILSRTIAKEVAAEAFRQRVAVPVDETTLDRRLDETMWTPSYIPLEAV